MRQRIVIVGAGAHGAVVADILESAGTPAAAFFDDEQPPGTDILGVRVAGPIDALRDFDHDAVIVAIGDNGARRALTERLLAEGERLASAIHPFTAIARSASIGDGVMIAAGALVQPRATLGRGVVLNTKASVDHDTIIGDFAHVSAGGTVGAKCRIGDEALIALGASVASGLRVGARSVIGCGAAVVRDIGDDVVAFGVPARVRSARA